MMFEFRLPYCLADHAILDAAQEQAASNVDAGDLDGLTDLNRAVNANTVRYELVGVAESDLSEASKQAIITAFEDNLPGAAQFEVVDADQ